MDTDSLKSKIEELAGEGKIDELVQSLVNEKDRLEREIRKDYRSARRYVRAHPEQGVGASFLGGLLIGFVIAKLLD
jgi:ElaB/YqjD/DUF883 family membrane-anchored ribosome-binding protein